MQSLRRNASGENQMKLLIINDFAEFGGTEVQTKREYENFTAHGHEVFLMTFDPNKKKLFDNHFNIVLGKSVLSKVFNKLFVNKKLRKQIIEMIERIKPDYIHVNNAFACGLTLYSVLRNYKTVQTMRDYLAVCPKSTCIHDDFSVCEGYLYGKCSKCLSLKGRLKKRVYFNKVIKARKETVSMFVCPSQALTDKCAKNGYNIICLNNPFDFSKIKTTEKVCGKDKIYLYYGAINKIKGVEILIEAFKKFHATVADVRLVIIGKVASTYDDEFQKAIFGIDYIEYKGYMSNADMLNYMVNVYCTVVPSLWLENYPNTVLESMASRTLVIGSNRGGMVEMIENSRLLFDILSIDSLVDTLRFTYGLEENEYRQIVEANYTKVIERNSLETYYNQLCDVLHKLEK